MTDVVDLLKSDHEAAKRHLETFPLGVDSPGRDEAFVELVRTLVAHEVAEEVVVYPVVRDALPDGDKVADERIEEQGEAEELLKEMEQCGVGDAKFDQLFTKLRGAVVAHAALEERTAFDPLRSYVPNERLTELAERYESAKRAAPTHPHPDAPDTPPANRVTGPLAALVDKTRDAVHRAVA